MQALSWLRRSVRGSLNSKSTLETTTQLLDKDKKHISPSNTRQLQALIAVQNSPHHEQQAWPLARAVIHSQRIVLTKNTSGLAYQDYGAVPEYDPRSLILESQSHAFEKRIEARQAGPASISISTSRIQDLQYCISVSAQGNAQLFSY